MTGREKVAGLDVYEATKSPGSPLCIYGNEEGAEISSVTIYQRGGSIIGLVAFDTEGNRVAATGFIYADNDEDV